MYHVASTLDHFIAREDGSTTGFPEKGDHVDDYLQSLNNYDTVIMGRKTYEFGYDYGLEKGALAYPHMRHYIFSKTLQFDKKDDKLEIISNDQLEVVKNLKSEEGTPIYLCGGGAFAGFLLEHELIDELILKLNPVIFGKGIPLFGDCGKAADLALTDSKTYNSGVMLLSYKLIYE